MKLVQLRIKDRPEAALREALAAGPRCAGGTARCWWSTTTGASPIDLGCDWVHLGQEDLDTADRPRDPPRRA